MAESCHSLAGEKITAKMERSSVPVAVAHGRFWHRADRYRCRRNCVSFRMSYRRVQPPPGTSAGASDDGESRIKIFITGAAGYIGGSRPDRYRPTGDKHQQDQRSQPGGYIDQILKGAKPGELAIYQGAKFGPLLRRACARAFWIYLVRGNKSFAGSKQVWTLHAWNSTATAAPNSASPVPFGKSMVATTAPS